MIKYYVFTFALLLSSSLISIGQKLHPDLEIRQITENIFVHISPIILDNGARYPCNGMIYISNGEALVMDTPLSDSLSNVLIDWIENVKSAQVKGVVINHFHVDCNGGLNSFHKRNIPSYSLQLTHDLSEKEGNSTATNTFSDSLKLIIGENEVYNYSFGAAHTSDNIISWVPSEGTIFGGCQVKSIGAGKGNLADANVSEWPATIEKILTTLADYKIIIPGHGDYGGAELLEYTIELFSEQN